MSQEKLAFATIILVAAIIQPITTSFVSAQTSDYVKIKSNGSIEPADAPIQRNGDLYTLTGNIDQYLVIERNYTIVNGDGHRVGGVYGPLLVQSGYSYTADGLTNVTATNLIIDNSGILFFSAINSVISNITINNGTGIEISGEGNTISNVVVNFGRGLAISGKNNIVSYNHLNFVNYTYVENNPPPFGIYIGGSFNIVIGNWVVGTNGAGIDLDTSNFNVVYGNQIQENKIGIQTITIYSQGKAENNSVYYNNFVSNQQNYDDEMIMTAPHSITIWNNNMVGNYWADYTGVDANGDGKGDTPQSINENNRDNYPLMAPIDITGISNLPVPTPTATPNPTQTNSPSPNDSTPQSPPTNSPSPVAPEIPAIVLLPLLFAILSVALIIRYQKLVKKD